MIHWKKILSLLLFVLPIVLISFFLKSSLYFDLLRNQNGPSYFYLSYDWQKKAQLGTRQTTPNSTLYFGSSRTAYALDNSLAGSDNFNLSLMAASYAEMELLAKAMVIQHASAGKIYLELNPTSATLRHMKSMSSQAAETLFAPYLSPSPLASLKMQVSKNSIFMNHLILRDYIASVFSPQNDAFDDYKKFKRASHVKEFQEMNSVGYKGFISPMDMPSQHYSRSFSECSTMLNWIMSKDKNDDLSTGSRIFTRLIKSLKRISRQVIVWIPPSPPAKAPAFREESIIKDLTQIAQSLNVEVVDLRSGTEYSDSDFFDCVHPNKIGAEKIRSALFKN